MNHHSTHLKEGDQAPDLSAKNEKGELVSLKSLRGKKVILYFYPQDDTPTCTKESCNLRDNYASLKRKGYEVLGVSADDEQSHQKFIKKYDLPFSLLADTDKKVIKAYDVWGSKTIFGKTYDGIIRTTFVIDEKGKIEKIIRDVEAKDHAGQITENKSQLTGKS
ncbi:MAG TPA: thioredoxin-dependent thiol peroxidase [Bacteroidia bacterium]|jgi:peroxiredoxin Q/BCP|nr:thioredoxin-dependent thiol peroxidase [Bacteroidia bacterium]